MRSKDFDKIASEALKNNAGTTFDLYGLDAYELFALAQAFLRAGCQTSIDEAKLKLTVVRPS